MVLLKQTANPVRWSSLHEEESPGADSDQHETDSDQHEYGELDGLELAFQ